MNDHFVLSCSIQLILKYQKRGSQVLTQLEKYQIY